MAEKRDLRGECKKILSEALGRDLTQRESTEIIPSIRAQMASIMREDPQKWSAMTHDERVFAAAQRVRDAMKAESAHRRYVAHLQIVKAAEAQTKYANNSERGLYGYRSVGRILEDAYRSIRGIQQQYFSRIANELNEALPSGVLGLFENRGKALELVKALRGEKTDDKDALAAAKVIGQVFSDLRERFNRAGGDIGLLPDWALPQSHDADKIVKAANRLSRKRMKRFTAQENREAWINFISDKLDRSRYIDPNTGEPMDDNAFRTMLEGVWQTLVTDGNGDQFGSRVAGQHSGKRSDRYGQHRALHFKDAASYMEYEQMFGTGSVMQTITGRVRSMSKDIALLEALGPNPTTTYRRLRQIASQDLERARMVDPDMERAWKYRDWNGALGVTTDEMWSVLNGDADSPAGIGMVGRFMQGARNLQVAGKLGSAFISSFSDIPTYFIALGVNRINPLTTHFSLLSAFSKEDREFAARAGIMADTINSGLSRWFEDNVGNGVTGVLADATIRLSLLDAWTNLIRRTFSLNFMASTGKLVKTRRWGDLDPYDLARMKNHDITETDWNILRLAVPQEYKGCSMLTRESIEAIPVDALKRAGFTVGQRDRALSKWLSMIQDESFMASLEPDLATRTAASRGARRGTFSGEFWRSLMLFKSFPFAMMSRHFGRWNDLRRYGPAGSATAYAASVVVGTAIFGAISLQAANLVAGRDMQDMEKSKFWGNALSKGGGLGILGDMIYNGVFAESAYGAPNVISFLGPIAGSAFDTWDVGAGLLGEALYDRDTKVGAKALRLVRGNTPFLNIWYLKGALDHAVFNDLNEMLSPGYLRRQRQRAMRTQGQGYWWKQNELLPSRLPRFATAPRD